MPYKDKNKQLAYQREFYHRRRNAFFEGKECIWCGSEHELELDHIDPDYKVTHRVWSLSEAKRLEEISKCQILCKTCHNHKTMACDRHRTYGSHGSLTAYKNGCRCDLCKRHKAAHAKAYRNRVR